jgi:hypothetical protein
LNGGPNDVFVIQSNGPLTVAADIEVILTGGVQPKNIFWVVAGDVTVGTDSELQVSSWPDQRCCSKVAPRWKAVSGKEGRRPADGGDRGGGCILFLNNGNSWGWSWRRQRESLLKRTHSI